MPRSNSADRKRFSGGVGNPSCTLIALLLLAASALAATPQGAREAITPDELRRHTNFLASDTLEGRAAEGGSLGLPPDLMALRVAGLLRDGEYVNLGIGLPTLVSNYIEGRGVTLHSENGILGYGAFPAEGEEDLDLYNASGQLVTALPETSYFDSTVSFAMARSGRVTN